MPPQLFNYRSLLLLFALALLSRATLQAQTAAPTQDEGATQQTAPDPGNAKDSKQAGDADGDWQIFPFALPFGSSDIGNGAVANLILSSKTDDGRGDNTVFVSGAATDLGLNVLFTQGTHRRAGGWTYQWKLGVIANPQAQYFSRGNFQNLPEIEDHQEGRKAIPANRPESPDALRGREGSINANYVQDFLQTRDGTVQSTEINPGQEVLRQKQNRYYNFGVRRQVAEAAIIKRLGDTPLNISLSFAGARTQIDPLGGDRERGEFFTNSPTLLELERPVGFDASRDTVYSNALSAGVEFNTLPEERDSHPNSGVRSGLRYEGAGESTGSHYTYGRLFAYHHHYLELFDDFFQPGGRELVFAHRLFAGQTFEDIPFFEDRGLGGSRLRGYAGNQFVDRVTVGGGVELRFTAFPSAKPGGIAVGFLVFGDAGRVGATPREIDSRGWHHAAGGGVDVIIAERFAVEFVAGASRFEQFFTLTIGHTFALRD
ncbi:MAG: BamA/TamA family outer membrane protein [bacterium]|nr:BamA/TamA family outer membrane protein [bacterium]